MVQASPIGEISVCDDEIRTRYNSSNSSNNMGDICTIDVKKFDELEQKGAIYYTGINITFDIKIYSNY